MNQIEIRKVANGFIVTVNTEIEEDREFIFTKESQVIKFMKEYFDHE